MTWFWAAVLSFALAGPVNDQLAQHGLRLMNDSSWSVKKSNSGSPQLHDLEIQNPDFTIELRILQGLTTYQTEQEAKTEYASILSAYKTALTPYAGAVSRKLSCAPEFLPKDLRSEFAGQRARVLFGFASERKTFGVCNADEAKMEFAFLTAQLPENRFVKLTGFRKKTAKRDLEAWKQMLAGFQQLPRSKGGESGGAKPTKN